MLLVETDDHFLAIDMLTEMGYVNEFVGVWVIIYSGEMMAASGLVISALENGREYRRLNLGQRLRPHYPWTICPVKDGT